MKAASLAVSPDTDLLASFYTHLTTHDPKFASTESQQYLSRRLRDVLLKMLAIVGGPQVLSVLMPLAKAEGDTESKSAASELNNKWSVPRSAPSSNFLLITIQAS
jgi:hypothetical protein